MGRVRRVWRAAVVLTIIAAILGVLRRIDGLPEGLTGSYYRTTDWSAGAAVVNVDKQPSTAAMVIAWDRNPPPEFSRPLPQPAPASGGRIADGDWARRHR